MAGEFKGLTIKFRGDASDLSKALATINNDMRVTTRSGMEVNRILAMKGASGNVKLLAQNVKIAGDRCKEWQERIDVLKDGQDKLRMKNAVAEEWLERLGERTEENAEAYDELTKEIEKNNAAYEHAQEEIERAEARLEAYTQQLHEAEAAYDRNATKLGQFGQKLQDVGTGMQALGGGMQSAGATLTRTVTAPLVALGTVSVKSAVEVDTALTGVRKTLDATEDQYQALKDAAIESSKVQPVDAATILDIEALGAQLGFSLGELQEFSRVASGLDVATDMNWEDAATNMAQFSNIMKMSHDDVGRYGSTIVALGNNFATTESSVSDMAMRIAAAGASLGMSEADVLGLAGALTSMGVSAEAGGSSISTIMSNIDKDVASGNENLSRWAETAGMTADQFADAWGKDPVDALARVLSGLDAATEEGSSMAVMLDELGIGSIRQTDVMKRLAGNTDLMTDAVRMANEAWAENTALQAEVDNRNESLASKLQVAANKLQAIAIEVGGPLADALIGAIDAAEPLIQKVGDLAKAFADMDESQQRNVIKLGLMAAAAGPLLTVFGKLTSGAGNLVSKFGAGAQAIAVFRGQMDRGNGIATALKTALGDNVGALTGLKVALGAVGLVAFIALMAKVTEHWREGRRRAQELGDALSGMKANTEGLGRAMAIGSDGIKGLGSSASGAKSDIDGLLESLREHNERNAETRASAEGSIGMLQQYKDVVDRLAGAGSASAEDMALLEWALKGIEEQTGRTYEASDVLAGKYQDEAGETHNLRDEIDQLIDAKKREAEASAIQTMLTDTTTERMKAEKELAKAEQEVTDRTNNWLKANKDAIDPITGLKYTEDELLQKMKESDTTYKDAVASRNAAARSVAGLTEEEQTYLNMLGDLTEAENEHWGKREGIIMTTDKMRDACERLGIDAATLSQGLQDAGVSVEDFARIGGDQFAIMAEMAGGSIDQLIGYIQNYNATEFDSKYGELHVDGVGNVVDANGVIMEFNGTEFVPKYLDVETNAGEAAGEVEDLKQKSDAVTDKDAKVDAKVSGKNLVEDLDKSIKNVPKSTGVSMTANVYGKGSVDNLLSTLANANGRSYDVYFTTHNTTINETITKNRARGAIISHADGDILMANRRGDGVMWDAYNRIGEQGAEAIVPLQKPFADGFADVIAESMARQGLMGQQPIDYDRLGGAVAAALAGMAVNIDGRALVGEIASQASRVSRMYAG